MSDDPRILPVLDPEDDTPVCSPAAYVSNEEAAVVAAMRRVKEEATSLRSRLEAETDPSRRAEVDARLEELRTEWRALSERREEAYRRKMIMLGHLAPDEVELL